jgi:predicted nucleic acid-binding protein
MRIVFADTCYWIALLNPRDQLYDKAVSVSRGLGEARISTTDEVLTELLNYFGARGTFFRTAATRLVERIQLDRTIRVVEQDHAGFTSGYRLYRSRPDKGYSLTDCISMEIMRREAIDEALSNDEHFSQEGFRCLLRD